MQALDMSEDDEEPLPLHPASQDHTSPPSSSVLQLLSMTDDSGKGFCDRQNLCLARSLRLPDSLTQTPRAPEAGASNNPLASLCQTSGSESGSGSMCHTSGSGSGTIYPALPAGLLGSSPL